MSNERVALAPILLAALVALSVAYHRVRDEHRYDQHAALVADWGEVQALAGYSGRSAAEVLAELKRAGLTAVAIEEPTVDELVRSGALRVTALGGGNFRLEALSSAALPALDGLARKFSLRAHAEAAGRMTLQAPWSAAGASGGGLDPEAFAAVRRAGLDPVARLRNAPGMTEGDVDASLKSAVDNGAQLVIFSGDKVLGYRDLVLRTAQDIKAWNLTWGRIEFATQKGEDKLADAILKKGPRLGSYARVHSVNEGEMAKLAPPVIVDRFRRAVKERRIRVCFIRLLLDPDQNPLANNVTFIGDIRKAILDSGVGLGNTRNLKLPMQFVGRAPLLTIGTLGVAAPLALLLVLFTGPWETRRWVLWWLVLGLLSAAVGLVKPGLYARGMGLLAGIVYPTLGSRWAWLRLQTPPRGVAGAIGLLWGACGWSVLGGLMIIGLLSQTSFMLAHDTFMGVKATQTVPLLLAAVIVATGLTLPEVTRDEVRRRWQSFWSAPLRLEHIVLAFVVLVVLALLLVRSGNEGMEVSETELRFRSILERVFGARPRTKEFLIGHPALILAALMARTEGRRAWVGPCFLVGVIGIMSTLNTFCHLHTPVWQSLLRTFHALWIGTLLGLLAYAVLRPKGPAIERTDA